MGIAKISGRERALQYEKKGRGHEQETHYFHGNDFGRSRGTGADDGLVSVLVDHGDDPGGGTYTPPLGERLAADTFTWN